MAFTLPELGYEYDGLQPYIDAETMEIHHSKHHNAYVNNLNAAIKDTEFESMELEDIMKHISKASPAIRNNGGGHYNHSLFGNYCHQTELIHQEKYWMVSTKNGLQWTSSKKSLLKLQLQDLAQVGLGW